MVFIPFKEGYAKDLLIEQNHGPSLLDSQGPRSLNIVKRSRIHWTELTAQLVGQNYRANLPDRIKGFSHWTDSRTQLTRWNPIQWIESGTYVIGQNQEPSSMVRNSHWTKSGAQLHGQKLSLDRIRNPAPWAETLTGWNQQSISQDTIRNLCHRTELKTHLAGQNQGSNSPNRMTVI